jgi:hypothetical protein
MTAAAPAGGDRGQSGAPPTVVERSGTVAQPEQLPHPRRWDPVSGADVVVRGTD